RPSSGAGAATARPWRSRARARRSPPPAGRRRGAGDRPARRTRAEPRGAPRGPAPPTRGPAPRKPSRPGRARSTRSRGDVASSRAPEVSLRAHVVPERGHTLIDRLRLRIEYQLGAQRRFVGRRDTRELGDLPGARLLVQALHVAALAGLHARLDVHL